jgi:hypothetical protein
MIAETERSGRASGHLAQYLIAVSWGCFALNLAISEVENRLSSSYYPSGPERWFEFTIFGGFVVFGWLAVPMSIKTRNAGLIVASVASVILSSSSIAVVVWLRASGCC